MKKNLITLAACILMGGNLMAQSIVVYFSRADENYSVGYITEGNTAKVAKEIAAQTKSDIWEIKPAKPYPKDYNSCIKQAKDEQQKNARPEIAGEIPDLTKYDTIYLGTPNWWGDMPMCVYTFLDKVDLSKKNIKIFVTHEGSGASRIPDSVKKEEPTATVSKPLTIRGKTSQTDKASVEKSVKEWLK